MFVALSIPDWPTGAAGNDLLVVLLEEAPRAAITPATRTAWLDARSLDAATLTQRACAALAAHGIVVQRAAASQIPVVAEIASHYAPGLPSSLEGVHSPDSQLLAIAPGTERNWLAPLPISVLNVSDTVHHLLHGVGITRVGQLAALSHSSVEVRFGRDGLLAWHRARADDRRPIFSARPREYPSASFDWTDFSTIDLEQLVFVFNSLLGALAHQLAANGMGARTLQVTLALENRALLTQPVTAARSTSQRTTWLRLIRRALEKISLPDRVTGIAVEVVAAGPPTIRQGDLFDFGFATAHAAESAVSHILDLQPDAVLTPQHSHHTLRERRVTWKVEAQASVTRSMQDEAGTPTLHPLLLPSPRAITVLTRWRRGFATPVHYVDNGTRVPLVHSLGPHCVSGEQWTEGFAREYHQCVHEDGQMVLLYRDVRDDQWFLAGWWG